MSNERGRPRPLFLGITCITPENPFFLDYTVHKSLDRGNNRENIVPHNTQKPWETKHERSRGACCHNADQAY